MLKKIENGLNKIINAQTGRVKLVKHYKNGLVDGEIIYYWDNGQIRLTGQYKEMCRVGIWTNYDSNGDILLEEDCNKNEMHTAIDKQFL
jgi:antitoxin component YwqK of YwqJK toxin-antitoxin module